MSRGDCRGRLSAQSRRRWFRSSGKTLYLLACRPTEIGSTQRKLPTSPCSNLTACPGDRNARRRSDRMVRSAGAIGATRRGPAQHGVRLGGAHLGFAYPPFHVASRIPPRDFKPSWSLDSRPRAARPPARVDSRRPSLRSLGDRPSTFVGQDSIEERLNVLPFVAALPGFESGSSGVSAGDPLWAPGDRGGDEDR